MAVCSDSIRGINVSGAEFSSKKLPGRLSFDYFFPTQQDLQYYKNKGFNAIRFPILWERLQPELFGEVDHNYYSYINQLLNDANEVGINVVIDLHNYGRYRGSLVGSEEVPFSAFADIWFRLAGLINTSPALYAYGIMNEPHDTKGLWFEAAQVAVDAIRQVDSIHRIYVAGDHWSNSHIWHKVQPKPFVKDSANLIVYEAHTYFDKDFSGRYKNSNQLPQEPVALVLNSFTKWLKEHNQKGAIGEWGMPADNPEWLPIAESFLIEADKHCLDWFVWAGGPRWGNYQLSLQPVNGEEKVLMVFLHNHLMQFSQKTTALPSSD